MVILMYYFDNLLFLKDRNSLTNIQMASIINVSDSLYSRYEKGKEIIPLKHLNTYSNYFDVSIDYMLNFTKTKKYKNNNENINLELLSKRLKDLRKAENLTQDKLAKKINIKNTNISKYECQKVLISTICLYKICKQYNISADYLLGKINSPKHFILS